MPTDPFHLTIKRTFQHYYVSMNNYKENSAALHNSENDKKVCLYLHYDMRLHAPATKKSQYLKFKTLLRSLTVLKEDQSFQ